MSDEFVAAIARRLREARQRAGWTQEGLAERIGIEPATLSRYERGRASIPLLVLWKVAGVLGVALAALVDVRKTLPRRFAPPPPPGRPRSTEENQLLEA